MPAWAYSLPAANPVFSARSARPRILPKKCRRMQYLYTIAHLYTSVQKARTLHPCARFVRSQPRLRNMPRMHKTKHCELIQSSVFHGLTNKQLSGKILHACITRLDKFTQKNGLQCHMDCNATQPLAISVGAKTPAAVPEECLENPVLRSKTPTLECPTQTAAGSAGTEF